MIVVGIAVSAAADAGIVVAESPTLHAPASGTVAFLDHLFEVKNELMLVDGSSHASPLMFIAHLRTTCLNILMVHNTVSFKSKFNHFLCPIFEIY